MTRLLSVFLFLLILLASGCKNAQDGGGAPKPKKKKKPSTISKQALSKYEVINKTPAVALKIRNKVEQLAYIMEGSFSSEAQHKQAPLDYYNVVLHAYPIWKNRTDGRWFYVEQSLAKLQNEPYRQRIYHVYELSADTVVSEAFTFPDPLKYVGAWKKLADKQQSDPFEGVSVRDLKSREGCGVYLVQEANGVFIGKTQKGTCTSERKDGTSYILSEALISFTKLITWDRGFNENDERVWGAEKGGYTFDRLTPTKILNLIEPPKPTK